MRYNDTEISSNIIVKDNDGNTYKVLLTKHEKFTTTAREWNQKDRVEFYAPEEFDNSFSTAPMWGDFPNLSWLNNEEENGRKAYAVRNKYAEIDKAWDKHNRTLKKAWIEVIRTVLEEKGLTKQLDGLRWSQKAGCGCGCSPAFVTKANTHTDYSIELVPTLIPAN